MIRQIAGALILVMLFVGFVVTGDSLAENQGSALESNHLRNSAFDDVSFWLLKGEADFASGVGRGGSGAVTLTSNREYDAEIIQTVGPRLVTDRRYTISAWVRATTDDAVAVIGIRWDGGHPRVFRGVRPEDGWSKIEFRFAAPEADGWRQVVLSGTGGLIWDDVSLYEADTLEARLAANWESLLLTEQDVFTGLVVNAKGTGLVRGMNPRIFDERGRLVFAGIDAGDVQMYTRGIVAYATDLATGTAHPRLEVSDIYPLRVPLVIDAQGVLGLPPTAVVIGDSDAERIRRAVQQYDFLGRFAIVFVLEPFAGL